MKPRRGRDTSARSPAGTCSGSAASARAGRRTDPRRARRDGTFPPGSGRPAARCAPGRIQHHIVDAGAQRVMRRPQQVHRDACIACLALERAQVLHDAFAQYRRVGRAAHRAQASEQLQQWRRGGGQWRDTDRRCRGWIDRRAPAIAASVGVGGGERRRPPGTGRMTVRSSSGSANGLSLTGASSGVAALAVVLGQAVMLHHPFQRKTVVRISRVDPGKGIGECLGVVLLVHCVPVDGSRRQQAAVFIECLRD